MSRRLFMGVLVGSALVMVTLVGACRKKKDTREAIPAPSPVVQVAPDMAPQAAPEPSSEERAHALNQPAVKTPPTQTQVSATLMPKLGDVQKCIVDAMGDKNLPAELRFIVMNDGRMRIANALGAEKAQPCVNEVMKSVKFAPWDPASGREESMNVTIPLGWKK